MMKYKVLYLVVIVITIIQISILVFYEEVSEKEIVPCITELKNVKYIKDIENEFNNISNSAILSYNKTNDSIWIIKCVLKGSKTEVLNALNKIEDYYINNYNLSYDNENIILELELKSK